MIYLDFAAATPMDKDVFAAMRPYFSVDFYNPAANYLPARKIKEDILEAKKSIAERIGAKHSEIIHTSGGTESNNLAISGIMDRFPDKKILVSAVEHESILDPAARYSPKLIPVDAQGMVDVEYFKKILDQDTVLVSVMLVNNEVGTIQPIKEISKIIEEERRRRIKKGSGLPLYLHTDACQAPRYLDLHASRLGVDMMTLNGGKIYGPKGSGVLFLAAGVEVVPQILGGGQQRNLRSGTESAASVIGFAKALDVVSDERNKQRRHAGNIRDIFINGLQKIIPDIKVNGHPKKHAPHIISVTFPGEDNETLLFQLEEAGILAASGSACSASSGKPSHVLGAMGLSDKEARSTIRFSFGHQTTEDDIRETLSELKKLVG